MLNEIRFPVRLWIRGGSGLVLFGVLSLPVLSVPVAVAQTEQETTSESHTSEADKTYSGPQVGEKLVPFQVIELVERDRVRKTQFIDPKRKGATFVMFFHDESRPALGLATTLEWYARKHKQLDSHYVFLTDDLTKTEQQLKSRWEFFAGSPLSISIDGIEGPGQYGLNRNVMVTVLIAKDNAVVNNFVLTDQIDSDPQAILAAVAEAIGERAPALDRLRAELGEDRTRRRREKLAENPIFTMAPNPRLGELMVATVDERVIEQYVSESIERMVEWAGDDATKQDELAIYCKSVLNGGFRINRHALAPLRSMAAK